jgi:hypothetical protein
LPIVGYAQFQHVGQTVLGAGDADVVFYETYFDKLGILTANATTPYVVTFTDLAKTGPLVIEMRCRRRHGR